jgi:2,3-bisphosphoglycerate-independent phosphoglycerate mutase
VVGGAEILVIPDGAAEPLRDGEPTSLERARTPALDALCRAGAVRAVETTPRGLPAGSETGIPTVLGVPLAEPVSRGLVEAASAGIDVPAGTRAWRCDAPRGYDVHHLRGHRMLLVGTERPSLTVWADGDSLPRVLDDSTVVVCGPGAAAGCGRLLGARVVIPPGATGEVVTDLGAKTTAALKALDAGARRVVVHVAAPDEAAHERDPAGKVTAIEAIDAQVIAPLAATGLRITVCPDHGADPYTGEHDGSPVPCVLSGPGVEPEGTHRMTERAVLLAGAVA